MIGTTYTALDGLRFGVVDDNAYFRRIVRTMLNGLGVRQVSEAATVSDGWDLLLRAKPDVLLVDWQLGDGTSGGIELLDRIRTSAIEAVATQTVVILSAHSDKRHVLMAAKLGANDFIVKPVSARVLYERIRRLALVRQSYVRRGGRLVPLPPGAHGHPGAQVHGRPPAGPRRPIDPADDGILYI